VLDRPHRQMTVSCKCTQVTDSKGPFISLTLDRKLRRTLPACAKLRSKVTYTRYTLTLI